MEQLKIFHQFFVKENKMDYVLKLELSVNKFTKLVDGQNKASDRYKNGYLDMHE